jgi:HAD superfamily phosphatase
MTPDLLVFDMDGVLVDVTASYRTAVQQTVKHFTGREPGFELIQDFKNRGGFNDDWILSHRLIHDFGGTTGYDDVVRKFNELFLGRNGGDGLILRERWIAHPGLFKRLSARFGLALFTGRRDYEVAPTLARCCPDLVFSPIVTADVVPQLKPAPDGLHYIARACPGKRLCYIGDTVDDARAAGAAAVPFIGIAAAASPRRAELVEVLRAENAIAVLEDINELETVL